MFSSAVQASIVSLFSSTGNDALALFESAVDPSLSSDSFIHLLEDSTSLPSPPPPQTLIKVSQIEDSEAVDASEGYRLHQTVLHLQSPTLRTTYIRCPPELDDGRDANVLGLKHPWIHMQVRNMGREWSFEVGIVDRSNREGVVRCSTFQREPQLKVGADTRQLPVLHLPLSFPATSGHLLTFWSTITLHLPSLLSRFSSGSLVGPDDDEQRSGSDGSDAERQPGSMFREEQSQRQGRRAEVPSGIYSHVSYVKVYATCRLRRIWFTDVGPGPDQNLPWEFQLFGSK